MNITPLEWKVSIPESKNLLISKSLKRKEKKFNNSTKF